MTRVHTLLVAAALVAGSIPAPAAAQGQSTPIQLRGVPSGPPTAAPVNLTLADAIHRGLEQNLSPIDDGHPGAQLTHILDNVR